MTIKQEPVVIKSRIRIDHNPIGLPLGTMIDIRVEIIDEFAVIKTSNDKFTRDLARSSSPDEIPKYSERLQKLIVKYPGKSQAEISKRIAKELASLPQGV